MSGVFGTPGDGRGEELAREYLATHSPAAPHVNRLLEMDRDAVMEAAAERVCGPVGCPPGSVFDGKEDSLADAVHQAVATALEKLGQLGYPVTFGPVSASLPAGLPATLASVDDVRRVCEAAGLERVTGEDVHPNAWISPDQTAGVAIAGIGSTMTGVHVQHVRRWLDGEHNPDDAQETAKVVPYVPGGGPTLWHAIQAARSTS